MAKDYSQHKMVKEDELYPYLIDMGQLKFTTYLLQIYQMVSKMKPNEGFDIDSANTLKIERDMYIKILCLIAYIHHGYYMFNDTYTYFYRAKQVKLITPPTNKDGQKTAKSK